MEQHWERAEGGNGGADRGIELGHESGTWELLVHRTMLFRVGGQRFEY